VWVNEEHLTPVASKGGSGTSEGGAAAAEKAPPSRKGLVAAIGALFSWLLWERWNAETLNEVILAGLNSARLFGGIGLNRDEHAHYEAAPNVLLALRLSLEWERIQKVEDLYVALFQEVTPEFLGEGPFPIASLTVAATRRERGIPVQMHTLNRSPEAAGWLVVTAMLARYTMEHAAGATMRGEHALAAEYERHALGLQWLIDAGGGVPSQDKGDKIEVPSADLLGDDFARRVRVDDAHLHVAVAEAWADELLEPLWQDASGQHDEVYEAARLRVLDGLVSAYARQVPRELAEGIAAGKRETVRPGEMGGVV